MNMNSKIKLTIAMVTLIGISAFCEDCRTGCETTFSVTDCSGAAVVGAQISVKICCGDNSATTGNTNSSGEVAFPYSIDDICDMRVALSGQTVMSLDRSNCSGDGKNSRCNVQICRR